MTTHMRTGRRSTGVLLIIALTLLSVAVASAQTSTTTKQVASTDSTAVTSVGLDAGVTSMAGDSNGNVYASLQFSNKVVKLNGGGTVIGTFTVGRNPTGLIVDNAGGFLYALNNADNTISKLKLDGTPVSTFAVVGDGPVHAALYAGVLYVACERSNTLVRVSASNGAALGSTEVGARPVWVVVGITTTRYSYGGGELVAAPADGTASDTTTAAPPSGEISSVPADGSAESTTVDPNADPSADTTSSAPTGDAAMAPGSDTTTTASPYKTTSTVSIYVSCNKDNRVWKLSNSGAVVGQFATGRGPFGLALNSKGEVLVACFWDAVVMRLSSTGTVLSKTAVGDGPAGMIPYGNSVAVISNGANSITRLSLAYGALISTDLVDRSPLIGAATPSALWVACTGSGTIARRAL